MRAWDEVRFGFLPRFSNAREVMTTHWRLNPAPITTYEAFDHVRDEHVWIRAFPSVFDIVEYEYTTLLRLQDSVSQVMRVHDLFLGPHYVAYSTERLNETTLRTYLERPSMGVDHAQLRVLLALLVRALDAVHQCGVVHRDVRPENVFIPAEGRVVLTGFAPEEQPWTADWVFYEDIMFYETEDRAHTGDLYAVGAILFEALAGGRGSSGGLGNFFTTGVAHKPDPAMIPPQSPEDLRLLCTALLDPNPHERPTAAEVLRTLEGA